jgi:hypothetical protein
MTLQCSSWLPKTILMAVVILAIQGLLMASAV